jgi:hypothetical protein
VLFRAQQASLYVLLQRFAIKKSKKRLNTAYRIPS